MLRIFMWFLSPEDMVAILKGAIIRLEAHSKAKEAEAAELYRKADDANESAAGAIVLSEGLKNLVG
jgi:hypothetical protein